MEMENIIRENCYDNLVMKLSLKKGRNVLNGSTDKRRLRKRQRSSY